MKKLALIAALALVAGGLFAQVGPGGQGGMMGPGRGMGFGPDVDWKLGTVVTTEYKKVTGQVASSTTLWGNGVTFKADGVEYQLLLPRVTELSTLKSGDTITIEGTFTSVKSETKVTPVVHAFKVTVGGKEIDLSTLQGGRGDKMGGRGNGPRN